MKDSESSDSRRWLSSRRSTPRVLSSDGHLLPPAVFREWLEQQDRIGGLVQLAHGVLGSHPGSPCPDADRLATAIASACYGAFVFDVTDWRRRLRVEDEAMHKSAKKLRPALNETSPAGRWRVDGTRRRFRR